MMYEIEIGKKGLLESAKKEEGCDIGAGIVSKLNDCIYEAFDLESAENIAHQTATRRLEKLRNDYKNCQDKEVEDLTEDEKFALCFFAGVEIDWMHLNETYMSYVPTTRNPVGIAKIDGKFQVYDRKG